MKVVGIILIITSSTLCGFWAGNEAARHCRALLQVQELLQLLMGEIRCQAAPFPEAFRRLSERVCLPWDQFLCGMAAEMESYSRKDMAEIWQDQVECLPSDCGLNREDRRELMRLGKGLGYLDREVQLNTIAQFLDGWQERRAEAVRDLKPRQKIYRCAGVSFGLVLALILA